MTRQTDTTDSSTYRIEARDNRREGWVPAPGDATGWSLAAARRAVARGSVRWLDGSIPREVRIVCEQDGRVVDD